MKAASLILAASVAFAAPAMAKPFAPAPTAETATASELAAIAASVATYSGKCPCPYTVKANGKPCGGNSAWSRPGGAVVLCYPADLASDD